MDGQKHELPMATNTKAKEIWRLTIHYASGDYVQEYEYLSSALTWAEQAIRQMGWPDRKHSKVTIERVAA